MLTNLYYLLLNFLIVIGPIMVSFDKKVNYFSSWRLFFKTVPLIASPFIIWDIIFTNFFIWEFNPNYHLSYTFFKLPIEEIAFFITAPFSIVFIYEVVKSYNFVSLIDFPNFNSKIFCLNGIAVAFLAIATMLFIATTTSYTTSVLFIVGVLLLNSYTHRKFLEIVWCYILILPGFLLINGVLTSVPIVIYNHLHITNYKIGSIPLEDFGYNFILLWWSIYCYDYMKIAKLKN